MNVEETYTAKKMNAFLFYMCFLSLIKADKVFSQ